MATYPFYSSVNFLALGLSNSYLLIIFYAMFIKTNAGFPFSSIVSGIITSSFGLINLSVARKNLESSNLL